MEEVETSSPWLLAPDVRDQIIRELTRVIRRMEQDYDFGELLPQLEMLGRGKSGEEVLQAILAWHREIDALYRECDDD